MMLQILQLRIYILNESGKLCYCSHLNSQAHDIKFLWLLSLTALCTPDIVNNRCLLVSINGVAGFKILAVVQRKSNFICIAINFYPMFRVKFIFCELNAWAFATGTLNICGESSRFAVKFNKWCFNDRLSRSISYIVSDSISWNKNSSTWNNMNLNGNLCSNFYNLR